MKPRDPPNSVHKIVTKGVDVVQYVFANGQRPERAPLGHRGLTPPHAPHMPRDTAARETRWQLDSSWLRTWGGAQAVEASQARHAVTQAIRRDTVAIKFKVGCASALADKPIQPLTARNNPTTVLLLLSCQHQRTCIRANK